MFYKYLFYLINKLYQKLENLLKTGETPFYVGSVLVGAIICFTIFDIFTILRYSIDDFFNLDNYPQPQLNISIMIGVQVLSTLYFGYKQKYLKVYNEISLLSKGKKVFYLVTNLIYVFIVMAIFFISSDIQRELNFGDGKLCAEYFIKIFNIQN